MTWTAWALLVMTLLGLGGGWRAGRRFERWRFPRGRGKKD